MFDEYIEPPTIDTPVPPAAATHGPNDLNGSSVSISIAQDAPSASHSPSSSNIQSPSVHQGTAVDNSFEVNPFAPLEDDPFVNTSAPESPSKASSSEDFNLAASLPYPQPHEHLRKWTIDPPIDNIIGNPSRPVSTRK